MIKSIDSSTAWVRTVCVGGRIVTRVVTVHGINNTYSGAHLMARDWIPALLDGVGLAGGARLLTEDDIGCAFYGDVFRKPGRPLGGDDLGWLGPDDIDGESEAELLQSWWEAASDTDPAVVPPGTRTLGLVQGVQAALAALSCSRFLAGTTERLLVLWLQQVRAYFTKPDLREQIQQRLAEAVGSDTEVVVAHSLGSVVAYEALCANPRWSVRSLVTLGSPLAIRNLVLDRLTPAPQCMHGSVRGAWPAGLVSWANIADRADFVALVKRLRPVFGDAVADVEIDNGAKMHRVERYLTAADTGSAIVSALCGGPVARDG
jgi:pimeloyl-ACP methyl ester carboxylesterase